MITWNYRVFHESDGDYIIREVFYAEDGSITGCTAEAIEPTGQTLEELAQNLDDLKAALALPILTLDDVPQPFALTQQSQRSRTLSHEQVRAQLGLATTPDIPKAPQQSRKQAS